MREKPVLGVILAGGQSRRMGVPKESLFLEGLLALLRSVTPHIIVSGHCEGYVLPADVSHLPDEHPGCGPISGLLSVLKSNRASRYLVLSCDQPLLTAQMLEILLDTAEENLGFFENQMPFPGVFPAAFLPELQRAFDQQQYSVKEVIHNSALGVEEILFADIDANALKGCNTPEELKTLQAKKMQVNL